MSYKCTCTECECETPAACLHRRHYCKCCVDDSSVYDDGMLYHMIDKMTKEGE